MKSRPIILAALLLPLALTAANNQILGWNNLGMHCMDSDYSVFSILPPYNTINAQLIVGGKLVTNGSGYTVTYQAVADAAGSINKSSIGKGNWQEHGTLIYGAVAPDQGLPFPGPASFWMPGASNTPQAMLFERTNQPAPGAFTPVNWYFAYGIPITPYDDAGNKNPYPMMRLIAKNPSNQPIATNDIVLPVSDEMDCRACHASGTQNTAQPAAGWVWSGNPERDFRLNILRLHDEKNFAAHSNLYSAALAARGYNPQGLYRGVTADAKAVLCAACHASEALATPSYGTIPQLTTSIHSAHAGVVDPVTGLTLDNTANRDACYRCHPGSATKCLRGAMGGAIAADGTMSMQCQSCHGGMSTVGAADRVGWFMEPNCQSCHTGTATSNNGKIRYVSSFESNGAMRVAVNQTFATQPNVPATGISLYRFSRGHGGLQCSACHGSTHAEFPATHANDNVRNERIQGHAGVTVECTACHASVPQTFVGGPHGLHPVGNTDFAVKRDGREQWFHGKAKEDGGPGLESCQACHGADYRGTELSRAQADRVIDTEEFGVKHYWRGYTIGCYDCHNGPNNELASPNTPPTAGNVAASTLNSVPVNLPLSATDPNGNPLTFRVVSQPAHGSVGVSNDVATYFPEAGYFGSDTFTFAANDTYSDSNLATGTVTVAQGPFSIGVAAQVPVNYPAGWPVAFAAVPSVTNHSGPVSFHWNFGDGSPASTNPFPTRIYSSVGTYAWNVTATVSNLSASAHGSINITAPVTLSPPVAQDSALNFSWPSAVAVVVEQSDTLGADTHWTAVTNLPVTGPGGATVQVPVADGNRFFRVRQVW
jgi:hypothetical protein